MLLAVLVVVGAVLASAVVVMAARMGDTARFVTWPVVAFTALASVVALLGVWAGRTTPWQLLAGVVPALVLSYVLPAAPLAVIAAVLAVLAALAVRVRGAVAGVAAATGLLMVVLVVLQGPAVNCDATSVSTSSGPWWIASPSGSSSSGHGSPDGRMGGTTQVGERHYEFRCEGDRLVSFEPAPSTTP